jgi:hypothetical protein
VGRGARRGARAAPRRVGGDAPARRRALPGGRGEPRAGVPGGGGAGHRAAARRERPGRPHPGRLQRAGGARERVGHLVRAVPRGGPEHAGALPRLRPARLQDRRREHRRRARRRAQGARLHARLRRDLRRAHDPAGPSRRPTRPPACPRTS